MATALDTLLDFVMVDAPKLPVAKAQAELRQAAIAFCRRSLCDRRDLSPFQTVQGTPDYALTAPAGMNITKVLRAWLTDDKWDLSPIRPDMIPNDARTNQRHPKQFLAKQGSGVLQLVYVPDGIYTVNVVIAVEPLPTTTTIEDWIAINYGRYIAHGALAELLAEPKKPWTDEAMAAYHKGKFEGYIAAAADDADKGFSRGPVRVRGVFGLK